MKLGKNIKKIISDNKLKIIFFILCFLILISTKEELNSVNKKNKDTINMINNDEGINITNPNQAKRLDTEGMVKLFMQNCYQKQYDEAYSLLSANAIQQKFTDINVFSNYIQSILQENKDYHIKLKDYFNNIYTIEIFDNMLAIGNFEKNNIQIVYAKVVKENNLKKIELVDEIIEE